MTLSWNEIKDRAVKFSATWKDASNEDQDAKPFLVDFFKVFGIESRKFGTFEHRVKKLDDHEGYIDLLWKANILVEMKSRGKDLDKAYKQAKDYLQGIPDYELPQVVMISDFDTIIVYDMKDDNRIVFKLNDLVNNITIFGFIAGYQKKVFKEQDPVNIKAAEKMGKFHDNLKEIGYSGHQLEMYLVRILFCLFAEDTGIFNKQQLQDFIEQRTNIDGSDLAGHLQELFQVLNTPEDKRFKNLDEQIAEFPFINGKLFEETLPVASFDSKMRQALLECCYIDWSMISPAIFGSMFQSVMNPIERRNLGAHYTSEKNIMKLIKPLFLDELWSEFEKVKNNKAKLDSFHEKISKLKFLDPACGCGNFLIITYRELRLLELEILKILYGGDEKYLDIGHIILISIDNFYGIEYEEFPSRIASVAMWLIDHQMNMLFSKEFGDYYCNIPLVKSANIVNENALRIEWKDAVKKDELSYILGNPPFVGSKLMSVEQRSDVVKLFKNNNNSGVLDYVTAWYVKAASFISNSLIKVAFVSTNSITQGEQVGILWGYLLKEYNIKIHFAHRTFKWGNEAKGNAAVYCVIVGFACFDIKNKYIYEYEHIKGEPHEVVVKNINPYLIDAKDILLSKSSNPICNVPKMNFGNIALDSGFLIFSETEKMDFISKEPKSEKWFKKLLGANELLYNETRWCLWLLDTSPKELKEMPFVLERIKNVKDARLKANDKGTQKLADRPHQFRDLNNPDCYIAIPITTGESRKYIPIVYANKDLIPAVTIQAIPNATLFHFGVLTSEMHMTWVKYVCGRLKSDFRYSKDIVYNNFPWAENPTDKQKESVEVCAQKVLDVRLKYPESSLADLYDPNTMPPDLVKAHNELDKAVDNCYRKEPFKSEAQRMEFLFELYEKYIAGNELKLGEDKENKARKK